MGNMQILQLVLILAALPILAWLISRTIKRSRELNERIDDYHKEQEALEKLRQQGLAGPINPYADMAELYKDDKEKDKGK